MYWTAEASGFSFLAEAENSEFPYRLWQPSLILYDAELKGAWRCTAAATCHGAQ